MATSTLQTNANEDLYMPDGRNLVVLTGVAACVQNIRQACKMRLGEDIYNTGSGVDYFGTIFTPQPNYDAARRSIINAILSCPDVISVESLVITISGNTFNYTASIMTIYGLQAVSS